MWPAALCSIVAAACLGEPECAVLASNDVFGDPCPGATKSLTFTYRCAGARGWSVSQVTAAAVGL